jgi:hypothetical protein
MNVWLADSDAPTPVIIHIHGGGFIQGNMKTRADSDIRKALDNGVSFVSIIYPFAEDTALHDIIRDNIARAVQFVRYKSAEWNIDPERLAAYGESAGAGSSLWLAFHDDIADPNSPDPVLRQSTRVVAAGALAPQATYDFLRWPQALNMSMRELKIMAGALIPLGLQLYHANSEQDLEQPEWQEIRRDLDMMDMIDENDPPVYVLSRYPDGPQLDFLHHPNHAKTIKKICDTHNAPAVLMFDDTPKDQYVNVMDFLLGYLDKPR